MPGCSWGIGPLLFYKGLSWCPVSGRGPPSQPTNLVLARAAPSRASTSLVGWWLPPIASTLAVGRGGAETPPRHRRLVELAGRPVVAVTPRSRTGRDDHNRLKIDSIGQALLLFFETRRSHSTGCNGSINWSEMRLVTCHCWVHGRGSLLSSHTTPPRGLRGIKIGRDHSTQSPPMEFSGMWCQRDKSHFRLLQMPLDVLTADPLHTTTTTILALTSVETERGRQQ